jgi:hypothetical protein
MRAAVCASLLILSLAAAAGRAAEKPAPLPAVERKE